MPAYGEALLAGRALAPRQLRPLAGGAMNLLLALFVLGGAVAFGIGIASAEASQVWSIYLVNLLFWSGLSVTGPAIAGMMELTEARWSPTVKRLALTTAGFLPLTLIGFILLFFGRAELYSWVLKPVPEKAIWLNVPFVFLRTLVGAALLIWVGFTFRVSGLPGRVGPDEAAAQTGLATTFPLPLRHPRVALGLRPRDVARPEVVQRPVRRVLRW